MIFMEYLLYNDIMISRMIQVFDVLLDFFGLGYLWKMYGDIYGISMI